MSSMTVIMPNYSENSKIIELNDIADQESSETETLNCQNVAEEENWNGLGYESMENETEYLSPAEISLEAQALIRAQKRDYRRHGDVLARLVKMAY